MSATSLTLSSWAREQKWQVKIPTTHSKALETPNADFWIAAEHEQIPKLEDNDTWTLVPRPKDSTQILPGKLVYDTKSEPDGTITEYRARWVVCGNFQKKSTNDTWSPVVGDMSMKLFLSLCAALGLKMYQADIIAAYLNDLLRRNKMLVAQHYGHEKGKGFVCLLGKAMYGLRESANMW